MCVVLAFNNFYLWQTQQTALAYFFFSSQKWPETPMSLVHHLISNTSNHHTVPSSSAFRIMFLLQIITCLFYFLNKLCVKYFWTNCVWIFVSEKMLHLGDVAAAVVFPYCFLLPPLSHSPLHQQESLCWWSYWWRIKRYQARQGGRHQRPDCGGGEHKYILFGFQKQLLTFTWPWVFYPFSQLE